MFVFKKIASQFFYPLPLSLLLCFAGLYFLWLTRRQRAGKILVTIGFGLIGLCSFRPVADALVSPLENQYPVYTELTNRFPKFVIVLSGGHTPDPRLPLTSRIGDDSLKRLLEGIHVFRQNSGSKLLISGGNWLENIPDAVAMAEIARDVGINESDVLVESKSRDTIDQARLLTPIIGTNEFVLVTSASHMSRSITLFQSQGLNPIPAPTAHIVKKRNWRDPSLVVPRASSLHDSERAIHEYLGLAWRKLQGLR